MFIRIIVIILDRCPYLVGGQKNILFMDCTYLTLHNLFFIHFVVL